MEQIQLILFWECSLLPTKNNRYFWMYWNADMYLPYNPGRTKPPNK
jgi:hypothetical protein